MSAASPAIEESLERGDSSTLVEALKSGQVVTFHFRYRRFLRHLPDMEDYKITPTRGLVYLLVPIVGLFKGLPEIHILKDNGSSCVTTIKWADEAALS